jgi:hypothetical protein
VTAVGFWTLPPNGTVDPTVASWLRRTRPVDDARERVARTRRRNPKISVRSRRHRSVATTSPSVASRSDARIASSVRFGRTSDATGTLPTTDRDHSTSATGRAGRGVRTRVCGRRRQPCVARARTRTDRRSDRGSGDRAASSRNGGNGRRHTAGPRRRHGQLLKSPTRRHGCATVHYHVAACRRRLLCYSTGTNVIALV